MKRLLLVLLLAIPCTAQLAARVPDGIYSCPTEQSGTCRRIDTPNGKFVVEYAATLTGRKLCDMGACWDTPEQGMAVRHFDTKTDAIIFMETLGPDVECRLYVADLVPLKRKIVEKKIPQPDQTEKHVKYE